MSANYKRLLSLGCASTALLASVHATELLVNGGFESGLTGWTVTDQAGGSGSFFANTGFASPVTGFATVGPASGLQYGISDQTGPGAHALSQSFTVAPGSTVWLSYDLFANNQNGTFYVDPAGLDYTASPNQHARVDLLTATADPLSTAAVDVLANFYLSADVGTPPNPYTSYGIDISSLVAAGGTYQIRFGEVDNQFFFQVGVDNVSVTTSSVPEASTNLAGIALAGLAGFNCWRRRRA